MPFEKALPASAPKAFAWSTLKMLLITLFTAFFVALTPLMTPLPKLDPSVLLALIAAFPKFVSSLLPESNVRFSADTPSLVSTTFLCTLSALLANMSSLLSNSVAPVAAASNFASKPPTWFSTPVSLLPALVAVGPNSLSALLNASTCFEDAEDCLPNESIRLIDFHNSPPTLLLATDKSSKDFVNKSICAALVAAVFPMLPMRLSMFPNVAPPSNFEAAAKFVIDAATLPIPLDALITLAEVPTAFNWVKTLLKLAHK